MKMKPAASFAPTLREVILLAALLCTLFVFVPGRPSLSSFTQRVPGLRVDSIDVAEEEVKVIESSLQYPEPQISWERGAVPETKVVNHAPGWTVFERLYVFNGTIYIVANDTTSVPETKMITSSGFVIANSQEEIRARLPSEKDIRVITPSQAQEIFSTTEALRLQGATFLVTDNKQFITHYYHFSAELLIGLWRAYTSLDPFIPESGQTNLPAPRRLMFRHVRENEWRDYAHMNQWVLRGAFPGISLEFKDDWEDRAEMGVPFVFDRVVLGDRAASMESEPFRATWRSASSAFDLPGSVHWWQPLRKSVLEFSGLSSSWINGPALGHHGEAGEKFVITYISRQEWGRRMLIKEDHEKLVEELYKLRDLYGYEVNVVSMDKLSRAEQLLLAGRTTVMMGVHGNGLTSLLWMRPKPQSTVIEFFFPQGFAMDYEWTTRALGMVHYGVWGSRTFTQPNVPHQPNYPEGFQGNAIPVDGEAVAKLVHQRLTLGQDKSEKVE